MKTEVKTADNNNRWFKDWQKLGNAISPPGPFCRDCADEDGTCPSDALPCDPTDRAIEIHNRLKVQNDELKKENERLREALEMCIPVVSEFSSKAYFAAKEALNPSNP